MQRTSRQESDLHFMRRALQLARRGAGRTSPNPLVGAVLVKNGRIVGSGYHVFSRLLHAEKIALLEAGEAARDSLLYLTLEPCSHSGRTPPCADEIVRAGVRRVFVATRDPNPLVNGSGIERLRKAGIEVVEGLCREEADRLNQAFFFRIRNGKSFATLKLALSLDGRIATETGASKWLTGEKARRVVHRVRYEQDAILVGIGTVRQDDPSLAVRSRRKNGIVKVVLDSSLRTPVSARLFESGDRVVIFHAEGASRRRIGQLSARAELVEVPRSHSGVCWESVLRALADRQLNSVLIEGGGAVAASALKAGAVQRLMLFYAPKIIGADGTPSFGALGVKDLEQALGARIDRIRRLDDDFVVEGRPLAATP